MNLQEKGASGMYSAEFDLETITPLFMAGADGKTPELRPPSFKGMIRFWWRAMRADNDWKQLAEDEAKIFGGTGKGEGKSKISIRIEYNNLSTKSYSPLPHKHVNFNLPAFDTGEKLKCLLNCEVSYEEDVISAFKLALLLGGFGKRGRRGFGSLSYKNFKNAEELISEIKEANIITDAPLTVDKKKSNTKRTVLNRNINNLPEYPSIQEIYLGHNSPTSANSVLEKIGKASHDHNDNALGTIMPQQRVASPIIATVIKINQAYYPVITKLSSHFPDSLNYDIKKQDDFINGVLNEQT
jgi:CRISPR-associated protein Cmr1